MENKKENKNNNRSFLLYVGLGLLIFFGVQQYNSTVNSPESKSFTIFKNDIQSGNVFEATIKEQSNLCLLYTSPSPRDNKASRMPSSA